MQHLTTEEYHQQIRPHNVLSQFMAENFLAAGVFVQRFVLSINTNAKRISKIKRGCLPNPKFR